MKKERTLRYGEEGYRKLEAVRALLDAFNKGLKFYLEDVYLDYGLDWMWTTIIVEDEHEHSWQILNPAQWGNIMEAESPEELLNIAKEITF